MTGIERVCSFLEEAQTYYLATEEGDQPRVRPFGTVLIYEGKLYIQTGRSKEVSRQLSVNPKAELCAFNGIKWIRISGELVDDNRKTPKEAMLEKYPQLKRIYSADDDNTQVMYLKNAVAVFYSFTEASETVRF